MPRIRSIKPTFWQNEELSEVSPEACLLAISLLNYADDEGYFKANEKLIEAFAFPLRELSTNIRRIIEELENIQYLELKMGSDGKKYGRVINFTKHQKVDRAKPSDIKALLEFDEESTKDRGSVPVGREGNGRDMGNARKLVPIQKFVKPTVELVREYCQSRSNGVDPQRFVDFYETKGWMVGKNRMKDWQAAVRTWEANDKNNSTQGADCEPWI